MVGIDSSLLFSLYVVDSNSPAAVTQMTPRPEVWLTPLHRAELANAIHRYVFRQRLSEFEARRVWKAFEDDCAMGAWDLVDFPFPAWNRSIDLARRHGSVLGIRTLDTLHVACAMELGAERFWTFDERQAKLAEAVGLDTGP